VCERSERLFVAIDGSGGAASSAATTAAATATAVGSVAADALDLDLRPAEARSEFVGDHFDRVALLSLAGLVLALLESAGDDDAMALVEARRGVLAEVAPGDHVEERGLLLPFTVLLVAPVDRQTEAGDTAAALGVAELGIARQVADERDVVLGCLVVPL
jgi:hypothetical protein